jgi:hypothetical protein
LKRFFAVLSVLFLLAAPILSYTQCRLFSAKVCIVLVQSTAQCPQAVEPAPATQCSQAVESSPAAKCSQAVESAPEAGACGSTGSVGCRTRPACRKPAKPRDVEACKPKPDCRPTICRLIPPLIADGPNRATPPTFETAVSELATIQFASVATSYTITPDPFPPWGVHPSIATTVLRI